MAVGNKSSSSLVHPVSFFSPSDSFLISCVWSCMCTWHLLADVAPPCPSAHIMHILLEPPNKASESTITASFVLFKVRGIAACLFCCRNWFPFICANEFLISLEVIYMEMAEYCDYISRVFLTFLWSRCLLGKLPLLPFAVLLILSAKINCCPF